MTKSRNTFEHQVGFILGTFIGIGITVWQASNTDSIKSSDLKKHLRQFTDQLPEAIDDLVDLIFKNKNSK